MTASSHTTPHAVPPSESEARARALQALLIEKGLIAAEEVDRLITAYEQDFGPLIGARVVARAWVDPAFKRRLLADGTAPRTCATWCCPSSRPTPTAGARPNWRRSSVAIR